VGSHALTRWCGCSRAGHANWAGKLNGVRGWSDSRPDMVWRLISQNWLVMQGQIRPRYVYEHVSMSDTANVSPFVVFDIFRRH
jgi:hypothetical protein